MIPNAYSSYPLMRQPLNRYLGRNVSASRRSLGPLSAVLVLCALSTTALAQQPSPAKAPAVQPAPLATQPALPEHPVVAPAASSTTAAAPTLPVEAADATPGPSNSTVDANASVPLPSAAITESKSMPAPSAAPVAKPPAPPETPLNALFDVALVFQDVWNTSPAYDYFSSDNQLPMGGLTIGVDVVDLTPATVLAVDVTALTGETEHSGPLSNYIWESSLSRTDLGGGVNVRHHIWYWLAPHVHVSAAAALERGTVTSGDFVDRLIVEETNFVGAVGAGFTLYSAAKRLSATRSTFNSLAFRLVAEGGYQFASGIPFEVAATTSPEGIPRAAIPLGELEQSGPYLRVAAGAHF